MHLLDRLALLNWGLLHAIISDRDCKFIGQLWHEIFQKLGADLLYSASYHPQTNSLSERSNQTAKIALRYYIMSLETPALWPLILPRIQLILNNSTKYSSTLQTPTEILHGFRAREALDFLRPLEPEPISRVETDNTGDTLNTVETPVYVLYALADISAY